MSTIEMNNLSRANHSGYNAGSRLTELAIHGATRIVSALRTYLRRRRDRAAFMNLLGKDEWVYRDMGVHRGDVEWASRLPLHVNAAEELEKLRTRNMTGRR